MASLNEDPQLKAQEQLRVPASELAKALESGEGDPAALEKFIAQKTQEAQLVATQELKANADLIKLAQQSANPKIIQEAQAIDNQATRLIRDFNSDVKGFKLKEVTKKEGNGEQETDEETMSPEEKSKKLKELKAAVERAMPKVKAREKEKQARVEELKAQIANIDQQLEILNRNIKTAITEDRKWPFQKRKKDYLDQRKEIEKEINELST